MIDALQVLLECVWALRFHKRLVQKCVLLYVLCILLKWVVLHLYIVKRLIIEFRLVQHLKVLASLQVVLRFEVRQMERRWTELFFMLFVLIHLRRIHALDSGWSIMELKNWLLHPNAFSHILSFQNYFLVLYRPIHFDTSYWNILALFLFLSKNILNERFHFSDSVIFLRRNRSLYGLSEFAVVDIQLFLVHVCYVNWLVFSLIGV